jgi:AraC-like DNA-binding protein
MLSSNGGAIDPSQAMDLVHRYFDAWNHLDVASIASFFTKDGVYFDVPQDAEYRGSGLVGYLADYLAEDDERRYAIAGEVLIGARTVAFRYHSFDIRFGADDPEPGAEFWVLLGDKVARVDDYYEVRPAGEFSTPSTKRSAAKYLKSGLSKAAADRYRARLLELMDNDKVYLQPDLSLPQLAEMVNCSVNHLSQVINAEFSMSFFEFLNQRRIADARQMLAADSKCHALDVALKVGFNSNSTFYSAFKKICQVTPAEYRRRAHGL